MDINLYRKVNSHMVNNNLLLRTWRYNGQRNLAFVDASRRDETTIYADDPVNLEDCGLSLNNGVITVNYKGAKDFINID